MVSAAWSSSFIKGREIFGFPRSFHTESSPPKLCGGERLWRVWITTRFSSSNFKGWYLEKQNLDDSERLRQMKISNANKGIRPWNRGRKHSPETIQRIRERTRLALLDPKVKLKLQHLGHAQSDETKRKIAEGLRKLWQRRREAAMVQEKCFLEWKNMIAEASRIGYADDIELQWNSYEVLNEQLRQMWLESIEKRKSMQRPGSRRTPKSAEQRRKISEAISAKWADSNYRKRVLSAMTKYHDTAVRAERKPRTKPARESSPGDKFSEKKQHAQSSQINMESKSINTTCKPRKNSAPSFKDPMAIANLELLKKIKADRDEVETKKRETTMRAKLLIAEAEKAAKALELAASKSPLAKASLLETRKLIAEATLTIESIEGGEVMSSQVGVTSDEPTEHLQNKSIPASETVLNELLVNGCQALSYGENGHKFYDINQHIIGNGIHGDDLWPVLEVEEDFESAFGHLPSLQQKTDIVELDRAETMAQDRTDLTAGAKRTKKWVCGRLVEAVEIC
ncbi:hypothetical protein HPP92_027909 [Vanilla planifolia]|uniref:Nuclease associated modular domain-containing protein n=1 Tax=Vanilla planifolia TaxID=51239 RepID=A0A835P7A7_VANPL|nr:hypothetical protein HPP92_027909 [Vanilla planifolia]